MPNPPPKSLADKVAQLLSVRIGSNLPPTKSATDDELRVAEIVRHCPIGGLILFNGVWPDVGGTLQRLQHASRWPLLVVADLERGAGQQVRGLTRFPHAAAFRGCGELAEEAVAVMAELTARQAAGAGVHGNLSPVADVNSNPTNPIIATRAYADSPADTEPLVRAFVRGAAAAGSVSCAKHFPGHGDTQQDSHATLPVVDKTLDELGAVELPPFRAAIAAGVPMIMTAHVAYPALDPTGAPATVSAPILRGLLREQMGFTGVVCSDSLLMAGVRDRFDSEGQAVVAAIRAGVDLQLDVADPNRVLDEVVRAVEAGDLEERLVDEAFQRVWRLKTGVLAAHPGEAPDPQAYESRAAELADRVATSAIRWRLPADTEPPRLTSPAPAIALLRGQRLPTDAPVAPLLAEVQGRLPDARTFELTAQSDPAEFEAALAALKSADEALLALVVKPAAWQAFGLDDKQRGFVERVVADVPDPIIASLGSPTVLADFPDRLRCVVTYSDELVSQRALASALAPRDA
ncbi:glycoside hydrolase family 3 N-terminal domain-containing protein [Botrimarina sp.]|uniref:glycoside hydrolase family 3 protein n=1 Tax=Botrimarina sp. TaxID=2795802 RepID=UPI0032EAA0A0